MRASPCGAALLGLMHYIHHSIYWYLIGLAANKWVGVKGRWGYGVLHLDGYGMVDR
jgi:hypothetical protein